MLLFISIGHSFIMRIDDSMIQSLASLIERFRKKIPSQHVSGCHSLKNYLSEETNDLAGAISIVCQD